MEGRKFDLKENHQKKCRKKNIENAISVVSDDRFANAA
jgi:hypothetical protein